jgi:catechol 2,3-dioxygenase-like lactoylglutathione lyase family enzyme
MHLITGGNVTVFVSDMDRAVSFYVDKLGLTLGQRFGNHWAEIRVGNTLVIGLHPQSDRAPAPGTSGAMSIGLSLDEPIDDVVQRLSAKGIQFRGPIVRDDQAGVCFAFLGDQDGNDLYLCQVVKSW